MFLKILAPAARCLLYHSKWLFGQVSSINKTGTTRQNPKLATQKLRCADRIIGDGFG
jgi:hypothetical protein